MMNKLLRLRCFEERDLPLLLNYLNTADVVKYLSSIIPQPYTKADAEWWINEGCRQCSTIKAIEFNENLVGCVSAQRKEHEYSHAAEVGYWIAKPFWNKGIASAALAKLISQVRDTTDIVRLQATVFAGNDASKAVLSKSGFLQEGLLKKAVFKNGKFYDAYIFGRVIQE